MNINKYDLGVKCSAVVASCKTPEHLAVADRYLKLARKVVRPHGLQAKRDLTNLASTMLEKPNQFVQGILDERARVKKERMEARRIKFESRQRH